MAVDYDRSAGRHYFEDGAKLEFAYPDFDSPQVRCTFLRNPLYAKPYSSKTMAQALTETPSRRVKASETSDVPADRFPVHWGIMNHGWPAGQRIKSSGTLLLPSTVNVSGSTDYKCSIGFRSFDGTAPTLIRMDELDSGDNVLASHTFSPSGSDLLTYPQGHLKRFSEAFTSQATTEKFRWRIESAGEDYIVAEPRCFQADGTESFPETSHYLDSDADGIGGGWQASGTPPTGEWYGEDWSGLSQWIELVSVGAVTTFEVRRYGTGLVQTMRLVEPLANIGAALHPSGNVSDVDLVLLVED